MHPRTQELLEHLDSTRARLRDSLEAIPVDRRRQRPSPDHWSAAEILEHLTLVERRITRIIVTQIEAARTDGLGTDPETSPVVDTLDTSALLDRSRRIQNSASSEPTGTLDAETAWTALQEARATLRDAVIASDGLALGELVQPHPVLGPLTMYQWVSFVGYHEARHSAQIREIAETLGED